MSEHVSLPPNSASQKIRQTRAAVQERDAPHLRRLLAVCAPVAQASKEDAKGAAALTISVLQHVITDGERRRHLQDVDDRKVRKDAIVELRAGPAVRRVSAEEAVQPFDGRLKLRAVAWLLRGAAGVIVRAGRHWVSRPHRAGGECALGRSERLDGGAWRDGAVPARAAPFRLRVDFGKRRRDSTHVSEFWPVETMY